MKEGIFFIGQSGGVMQEVKEYRPETYEDAVRVLNARQKKFVQLYLEDPNPAKAKVGAGYSEQTATQSILHSPAIARALELGFAEVMSSAEVKSRIAAIATASQEDFIEIRTVKRLTEQVYDVYEAMEICGDLTQEAERAVKTASGDDYKALRRELKRLDRVFARCARLVDRIKDGEKVSSEVVLKLEWESERRPFLDLDKAQRLGKMHLIKKLKQTKYGTEIELYDSTWALELLAKHYKIIDGEDTSKSGRMEIVRHIVTRVKE